MTTRARRGALVCSAVLAAALGLTGCSTDTAIDLSTIYAETEPWELATNPHDTTEELCAAAMPACVQAMSTDQAHYRKFDSQRVAEDFVSVAGNADVERTEMIVLEFIDPTLTDTDKDDLVRSVACIHSSADGC